MASLAGRVALLLATYVASSARLKSSLARNRAKKKLAPIHLRADPIALVETEARLSASNESEYLGCFPLAADDEGAVPDPTQSDRTCITYRGPHSCRSGLPFYRYSSPGFLHPDFCMQLCLAKGFDIFGIVAPKRGGGNPECRCSASTANIQVWHGQSIRPQLVLPSAFSGPLPQGLECPVRVWQYDKAYVARTGGTPLEHLSIFLADELYVDSIIDGRDRSNIEYEDSSFSLTNIESDRDGLQEGSSRPHIGKMDNIEQEKGGPIFERDCSLEQCAGGRPWGRKIYLAFTKDVLNDNIIHSGVLKAAQRISDHVPCITFEVLSQTRAYTKEDFGYTRWTTVSPSDGTILIGHEGRDSGCFTQGIGFPGAYGMRYINLGWCSTSRHIGTMMHELGHALGMNHQHKRANATRSYRGHGPYVEIDVDMIKESAASRGMDPENAVYQYRKDEKTYMGSLARGGHVPFDYGSIMMYPADAEMRTLPHGRFDHMTGQRRDYSAGDVAQLKDMYGCYYGEARCPKFAEHRTPEGGDCECPGGTYCFQGGRNQCETTSSKFSREYFRSSCKDCKCVATKCHASAAASKANIDGDCECPANTLCHQKGRLGCMSSDANYDQAKFASSCANCQCMAASCPQNSGAEFDMPAKDGDCKCPKGTTCHRGSTKGCPISDGPTGRYIDYFQATCEDCRCVADPKPVAQTCVGGGAPDSQGDCQCTTGTSCFKGTHKCPSASGRSARFYSVSCQSCKCVPDREGTVSRVSAYQPDKWCTTKCGATEVTETITLPGRGTFRGTSMNVHWDLTPLDLRKNACGRCHVSKQSSRRHGACYQTFSDGRRLGDHYELISSGQFADICCYAMHCELDDPCESANCGENSVCQVDGSSGVASCVCKQGYEENPESEGFDDPGCIPKKPHGARCCYHARWTPQPFMWIPREHQMKHWWPLTSKLICPKIDGLKGDHEEDSKCERKRAIYRGKSQTVLM